MADEPWLAGKRRWNVWIGRRKQEPDLAGPGLTESFVEVERVWANVVPIGALTFWSTSQTDTPVTHRIWTRWLGYVDNTYAILRDVVLPDGSTRRERFRVRRVAEDQGRKRYTMLEVELEQLG